MINLDIMRARPYVIAHRGASFHTPENTLFAFRKAMELGADGVETDVQLTFDGKMVLHHNYSISTGPEIGRIADMTLEEVRAIDYGSHIAPRYAGETIPTLDEFLDMADSMAVVNIELKAPMDRSLPYVAPVVEAVRRHGLIDKVILSAFDHSLLREAKVLCPSLRVGALTLPPNMTSLPVFTLLSRCVNEDIPLSVLTLEDIHFPVDADLSVLEINGRNPVLTAQEYLHSIVALYPYSTLRQVKENLKKQVDLVAYLHELDFKPDFVHMEYHSLLLDPLLPQKLSKLGVGSTPWTVDESEVLSTLLPLGCYAIITNRPDTLLSLLENNASHAGN